MGSHVAVSGSPLNGWIGEHHAVFAGGAFKNLLAAFTFFYDNVTIAAVKL